MVFFTFFAQCKTEEVMPNNIILYNKPLKTIQQCIYGKWKLEYSYGGLCAHKYIGTHNSYMILNSNRIILGNDSTQFVNSTIVWKKTDIGSNEFTYLLNFNLNENLSTESQIIDQIKNDTLITRDYYVSDGFSYYYTRYK
jgi:hypothetical protein